MYNARYLQPQVSTVGLIAHYKLWAGPTTTGKVFDYSLRGHGGTLQGTSPTFKYPGIDLPGTNEYIEITNHVDFSPILTPFSISVWVYMHSATNFMIISKGVIDTKGEWWFYTGAGDQLGFIVMDEDQATCYIGRYYSNALSANVWMNFVATYGGGTTSASIKLYSNGTRIDDNDLQNNQGNFVTLRNDTVAVWIGRYSTFYADGLIDNVMFFNKELLATEAKSIYEVTRQRYGV